MRRKTSLARAALWPPTDNDFDFNPFSLDDSERGEGESTLAGPTPRGAPFGWSRGLERMPAGQKERQPWGCPSPLALPEILLRLSVRAEGAYHAVLVVRGAERTGDSGRIFVRSIKLSEEYRLPLASPGCGWFSVASDSHC